MEFTLSKSTVEIYKLRGKHGFGLTLQLMRKKKQDVSRLPVIGDPGSTIGAHAENHSKSSYAVLIFITPQESSVKDAGSMQMPR